MSIRVNRIAPGLVDTKMTRVTTANPKRLEGAIERIPLKRLGTPADMAGAALFLASPEADYVPARCSPSTAGPLPGACTCRSAPRRRADRRQV